jgi:hypothetical protein
MRCLCCRGRVRGDVCLLCGPVGTYDPAADGWRDCPACDGDGLVRVDNYYRPLACPTCGGKGLVLG